MSVPQFAVALVRLAAVALPLLASARWLRKAHVPVTGALTPLVDAVLGISVLLIEAELLGLVGLLRSGPLIAMAVATAACSYANRRRAELRAGRAGEQRARPVDAASRADALRDRSRRPVTAGLVIVLVVVVAQWGLGTANALGGGMFNFDTLWYHMPFAAEYAQSGSVTAIHFTQADPYTAYYPANSELIHAVGIVLMHGDFLSPLINLGWLAVGLVACWCVGMPWRVEPRTLLAGTVVLGLPVLSSTQPGEAFNDIPGWAMLFAAIALMANAERSRRLLVVAGLALGFSVGTKYTFLVPALVLGIGLPFLLRGASWSTAVRGARRSTGALAAGALLLTAGWWYVRDLLDIGNPLGVQLHVGPLLIAGPVSPLANAASQTVLSELGHTSLWSSRFSPGLAHMLGPLWPLVILLFLAGTLAGLRSADPVLRLLGLAAGASGLAYLVFPTGASDLANGTTLFEVNLRYATPALAIGLVVLPIVLRTRPPRWLTGVALLMVMILLSAQLERPLWPTQPARHAAFLLSAGVVALAVLIPWRRWQGKALGGGRRFAGRHVGPRFALTGRRGGAVLGLAGLLVSAGVSYGAQRHYYAQRYLMGGATEPGLAAIDHWAQHVSGERVALYGSVEQYPLYGARDTNRVAYLGQPAAHGGYGPISSCRRWRQTINYGRYDYLVLTPAPTVAIPVAWTLDDPAAKTVLHPTANTYLFRLTGRLSPRQCR